MIGGRNLKADPTASGMGFHQFKEAGVFPSVIGEALDALELVAFTVADRWRGHAAPKKSQGNSTPFVSARRAI